MNTQRESRGTPSFVALVSGVLVAAPVVGVWLGLGWRLFRAAAGW